MIKVSVLLADGFEEIEGLTVVDLLRRAQIYVATVAIGEDYLVQGSNGISVQADELFADADFSDVDVLVLPGGQPGTTHLKEHEGVRAVIKEFAEKEKLIAAICAAPTVLADLGLLEGKRATCYPAVEEELKGAVVTRVPVTVDGNFITSRGLGTAIDFALEIITVLMGKQKALEVAESVVYE